MSICGCICLLAHEATQAPYLILVKTAGKWANPVLRFTEHPPFLCTSGLLRQLPTPSSHSSGCRHPSHYRHCFSWLLVAPSATSGPTRGTARGPRYGPERGSGNAAPSTREGRQLAAPGRAEASGAAHRKGTAAAGRRQVENVWALFSFLLQVAGEQANLETASRSLPRNPRIAVDLRSCRYLPNP